MAKFALPVSKQSKKWKASHKRGPAFPINSRRQASSARGFAGMMGNKGQLTVGEAKQIVKATTGAGLDPAKLVKKDGKYRTVKTNPRKTKSMAKRKTRTVRKASKTSRRGTRKGQVRKTRAAGRRAYVGTKQAKAARRRRSARRNPALLRSPAARFSIAAVAGAAAASALDANATAGGVASRLRIPIGGMTLSAGVTGFLLTMGVTRVFKLKAATKATATAAAFGMLAPSAIQLVQGFTAGNGGNAAATIEGTVESFRRRALSTPRVPAAPSYNSAAVFVDDLIPA